MNEQQMALLAQLYAARQNTPTGQPNTRMNLSSATGNYDAYLGDNMATQFGVGVDNLQSSLQMTIAAANSFINGADSDFTRSMVDAAERNQKSAAAASYIPDSLVGAGLAYTAQSAPGTMAALAGGLGGLAVKGAAGALAGSALASFPQHYGENISGQMDNGASLEDARVDALAPAALNTGLDLASLALGGAAAKSALGAATAKTAEGAVPTSLLSRTTGVLAPAAGSVAVESGTEAAQKAISMGMDPNSQFAFGDAGFNYNVAEAAKAGALAAGTVHSPSVAVGLAGALGRQPEQGTVDVVDANTGEVLGSSTGPTAPQTVSNVPALIRNQGGYPTSEPQTDSMPPMDQLDTPTIMRNSGTLPQEFDLGLIVGDRQFTYGKAVENNLAKYFGITPEEAANTLSAVAPEETNLSVWSTPAVERAAKVLEQQFFDGVTNVHPDKLRTDGVAQADAVQGLLGQLAQLGSNKALLDPRVNSLDAMEQANAARIASQFVGPDRPEPQNLVAPNREQRKAAESGQVFDMLSGGFTTPRAEPVDLAPGRPALDRKTIDMFDVEGNLLPEANAELVNNARIEADTKAVAEKFPLLLAKNLDDAAREEDMALFNAEQQRLQKQISDVTTKMDGVAAKVLPSGSLVPTKLEELGTVQLPVGTRKETIADTIAALEAKRDSYKRADAKERAQAAIDSLKAAVATVTNGRKKLLESSRMYSLYANELQRLEGDMSTLTAESREAKAVEARTQHPETLEPGADQNDKIKMASSRKIGDTLGYDVLGMDPNSEVISPVASREANVFGASIRKTFSSGNVKKAVALLRKAADSGQSRGAKLLSEIYNRILDTYQADIERGFKTSVGIKDLSEADVTSDTRPQETQGSFEAFYNGLTYGGKAEFRRAKREFESAMYEAGRKRLEETGERMQSFSLTDAEFWEKHYRPAVGSQLLGHFEPQNGGVFLSSSIENDQVFETAGHEIGHAVTHGRLRNPNSMPAKRIEALYNAVLKKLDGNITGEFNYQLSNVDEFVVGGLTNADFANYLASMELGGGKETALSRFMSSVKALLAWLFTKDKTVYEELLTQVDLLLDEDRYDTPATQDSSPLARKLGDTKAAPPAAGKNAPIRKKLSDIMDAVNGFLSRSGFGLAAYSFLAANTAVIRVVSPEIADRVSAALKRAKDDQRSAVSLIMMTMSESMDRHKLSDADRTKAMEAITGEIDEARLVEMYGKDSKIVDVARETRTALRKVYDDLVQPIFLGRAQADLEKAYQTKGDSDAVGKAAAKAVRDHLQLLSEPADIENAIRKGKNFFVVNADNKIVKVDGVPTTGQVFTLKHDRGHNHFPRVFDYDAIMRDKQGFIKQLMSATREDGTPFVEDEKAAESIFNDLTANPDYYYQLDAVHSAEPIGAPVSGREKARKYNLPNFVFGKYIKQDVATIVPVYMSQLMNSAAFLEAFGPMDMDADGNMDLRDDSNEIARMLNSIPDASIRQKVKRAVDASFNPNYQGARWSTEMRVAASAAQFAAAIAFMPLIVLSSLPEFANHIAAGRTALERDIAKKVMWKTITNVFSEKGRASNAMMRYRMESLGIISSELVDHAMHGISQAQEIMGVEGWLKSKTGDFYRRTGITRYTSFQEMLAGTIALESLRTASKALLSNETNVYDKQQAVSTLVRFTGVQPDAFANMPQADKVAAAKKLAQQVSVWEQGGEQSIFDGDTAEQKEANRAVNLAINEGVRVRVAHANAGDVPFYFNDPLGKVVGQFKRFFYGATANILPNLTANLQDGEYGEGAKQMLWFAGIGIPAAAIGLMAAHAVKYAAATEIGNAFTGANNPQTPFSVWQHDKDFATNLLTESTIYATTGMLAATPYYGIMERPGGLLEPLNWAASAGLVNTMWNKPESLVDNAALAAMMWYGGEKMSAQLDKRYKERIDSQRKL
jgi:hypothetical protein